jgi:hypothetical protein
MTIAEVPGFENEYSGTKSRLPENLVTPGSGPKSAIQLLLSGGFCNIKGHGRNEISKIKYQSAK